MKKMMLGALAVMLVLLTFVACGNGECDHEFGKWRITQEASCAGPGVQSRKCVECGYSQSEEIPATTTIPRKPFPQSPLPAPRRA